MKKAVFWKNNDGSDYSIEYFNLILKRVAYILRGTVIIPNGWIDLETSNLQPPKDIQLLSMPRMKTSLLLPNIQSPTVISIKY